MVTLANLYAFVRLVASASSDWTGDASDAPGIGLVRVASRSSPQVVCRQAQTRCSRPGRSEVETRGVI
jgi:hypothetical protein